MLHILIPLVFLISLVACTPPPVTTPQEALREAAWRSVPRLPDDAEFAGFGDALRASIGYYEKIAPGTIFYFGRDRATAREMTETLHELLLIVEDHALSADQKMERIRSNFTLYRSPGSDGRGRVLFTGYYEPLLSCREAADELYRYPLYKRPDDIIEIDLALFGEQFPKNKILGRLEAGGDKQRVVPYYTREEINHREALANRGMEILWCDDPVSIFFLQVQGSGKAELEDGRLVSILYDGQNGRPYRSIGKALIESGAVPREAMSMQTIRSYLRDHPDDVFRILNQNPSYVFFRTDTGPSRGSINVPLTPGRSIATDARLFPKGAPGLIVTEKPVIVNGSIAAWVPFLRFVMNQDTGGAIRGAGRVDLFWGQGAEAELSAGHMQHGGELYFLVKKRAPNNE